MKFSAENGVCRSETEPVIREAIASAAAGYIQGCESRIDGFVQRHYSFRGALEVHSHAIGWDIIRVPLNILWSVANIFLAITAFLAGLLQLKKLAGWIKRIPPGLKTDLDRQISWLVVTELLQLPYEQGGKKSTRDALMEEILKDPSLQLLLNEKLAAFDGPSGDPQFQRRVNAKLAEYDSTRNGSADLASNVVLLVSSKLVMGETSFGALNAGTTVAAAVAHSVAVSNFWLGSTIGSYYYAIVPVAVSMRLLIAVTTGIAIALSLVSVFIGVLTDPIQAKLGLHQRRLKKLVRAVGDDLLGKQGEEFQLREKYMGRLFDVIDMLTVVGRSL